MKAEQHLQTKSQALILIAYISYTNTVWLPKVQATVPKAWVDHTCLDLKYHIVTAVSKGNSAKGIEAAHDTFQPAHSIQIVLHTCRVHDNQTVSALTLYSSE